MFRKQQMLIGARFYERISWNHFDLTYTTIYPIADRFSVYDSLLGHSDVLACSVGSHLIAEPLTYEALLQYGAKNIKKGTRSVGSLYPQTCHYNALVTDMDVVHCFDYTDSEIIEATRKHRQMHVKQGYARCTTIALTNDVFLTSDPGIERLLVRANRTCILIEGSSILLSAAHHGFIGGTCGVDLNHNIWFYGHLKYHPFGDQVRTVIDSLGLTCIELRDAPLQDIGGLLFWPESG